MSVQSVFRPPSLRPWMPPELAQASKPPPSLLARLAKLPRARPRLASMAGRLALVEIRGVPVEALARFSAELERRARFEAGVEAVEVNPFLRRARFAVVPGRVELPQLERLVRNAERACLEPDADSQGLEPATRTALPAERELPDDELLELQRWVELLADGAGLGLGLVLRILPFVPKGLGLNAVVLLSLARTQPALRAPLDARLGRDRTDLLLNLVLSFSQGLAQRPVASLADIGYRVSALRELKARARTFARKRNDLLSTSGELDLSPQAIVRQRPVVLPKGPLEQYSSRAWITAVTAFGFGLLTSRSFRRAGAAALGALPKAAHLGREIYANEVSRLLSEQGSLVLAPEALRRLDRVDCLVIDGGLLSQARFSLGRIDVRPGPAAVHAKTRVHSMFDPRRPIELQQSGAFQLGPLPRLQARSDDDALALSAELSERGSLVLGLAHGDVLCAVVEVRIGGSSGIEELVDVAQQGGLRVLVASERKDAPSHLGGHPLDVLGSKELATGIAQLQRDGHVVCYVGRGPSPGYLHADCSVAVRDPNAPPPWSAHVVCEPDLAGLHTLLRASLLARGVSKQSVNLALGAAAVGTLASAGGQSGPSGRVMLVVNVAALVAMLNALQKAAPLRKGEARLLPDPTPWHALSPAAALARLQSGPAGLTDALADERKNLEAKGGEPSALRELGRAVAQEALNPLAPLLAAGAGLSALVGSTLDAGIVALVGGVSAVLGGAQRFRTERAISRLTQPVEQLVRVRRGGGTRQLPATELVPGDIVLLTPGEVVPADCRILEANALEVDTAILTGESLPTTKDATPSFESSLADRSCMLYAGTQVVGGSATAVVVAVGDQVETRRGGAGRELALGKSGVEARLRELMQLTGPIAAAGGLLVVLAGLARGRRTSELVETGVSMAVAAIPEGLPLLASAAQLSTAERLSHKGALVRNARCIEALGRVDVICLDKTGTLTEGRLELHLVSTATSAMSPSALSAAHRRVLAAALRATAESGAAIHHDPTDTALQAAARETGVERAEGHPGLRPHSERPFESARGYHAVVCRTDRGTLLSVKGAPERLLVRCREQELDGQLRPLGPESRDALVTRAAELAAKGLRVLAVAESEHEGNVEPSLDELCFRGFLAFRDATRRDATKTLERLRQAGIGVVMLTGDHPNTGRAIADEVGLPDGRESLSGGALTHMSDEELGERVERYGVFARVTPAQKVRIVRALQRRGRVVAMVGDGANDVPALRAAEVGIAVGRHCAPAARAAADIVLSDGALERLLDCVLEARAMWLSVRDAVAILLGGNLGEIGFTVAAGLVSGRPPLNPRQLLLVNLLTDVAPAMAIALRKPPADAYESLSLGRPEELLRSRLNRAIAARALCTAGGASTAWILGRLTGTKTRASTMALAALVGSQLGQTVLSRGSGRRVTVTALGSAAVLAAIVQTPGLSHLFGCRPMGPIGWSLALGSSLAATGASAALSAAEERLAQLWKARTEPLRARVVRTRTRPAPV